MKGIGYIGITPSMPRGIEAPVHENGKIARTETYNPQPPRTDENSTNNNHNLVRLAEIAFRNFPTTYAGETIHSREINTRLNELREAGHNVPPYSQLKKPQKTTLLNRIRRDIYRAAETGGLKNIIDGIIDANKQQREKEREYN
jgi:hypothetical protein